jgi:hypothetical protein
MQNKVDIFEKIKSFFLQREEILLVYLYGSFLKTNQWNDVDIALFVKKEKLKEKLKYTLRLCAELNKMLNIKEPDVRILNNAPLYFQFEVISTGKPILVRDKIFKIQYEANVISKWLDFRKLIEEYDKSMLQRIESW